MSMSEALRFLQRLAWALYLLSLAAGSFLLPDTVGAPGKTLPRTGYVLLMLVTMAPLPWLMCGGLLNWTRRHPDLLSIPNKDYWLAPERAAASWQRLDRQMQGLGALTLALVALLHYQAMAQGLTGWPALPEAWLDGGTLGLVLLMLFVLGGQMLQWRVSREALAAYRATAPSRTPAPRGPRRPAPRGGPRHG